MSLSTSGVGVRVDIFADAELAEIDPVPEHCPDAAGRHAETRGERNPRCTARREIAERGSYLVGLRVRYEPPGVRISPVAAGGLPPLPEAGLGGPLAEVLKSLGVQLALVLGVREHQRPHVPAVRRACVEVLLDTDDPAAGRLDAIPCAQLLADITAKS